MCSQQLRGVMSKTAESSIGSRTVHGTAFVVFPFPFLLWQKALSTLDFFSSWFVPHSASHLASVFVRICWTAGIPVRPWLYSSRPTPGPFSLQAPPDLISMVLEAVQTLSIALLASDFTVVASLSNVCESFDTNKKEVANNINPASNNQKRNQQESSCSSSSSNEQTSRQLPVRIELSDILSF